MIANVTNVIYRRVVEHPIYRAKQPLRADWPVRIFVLLDLLPYSRDFRKPVARYARKELAEGRQNAQKRFSIGNERAIDCNSIIQLRGVNIDLNDLGAARKVVGIRASLTNIETRAQDK